MSRPVLTAAAILAAALLGALSWWLVTGAEPDAARAAAIRGVPEARDEPLAVELDVGAVESSPVRRESAAPPAAVAESTPRPERRHELRGRVVDEAGEPIAAFEVQLVHQWRDDAGQLREEVRTEPFADPDGRFVIDGIEERVWWVLATAEGHEPLEQVRVEPPHPEPLLFRLAPCGSLSVRVVDSEGAPVAGARAYVLGSIAANSVRSRRGPHLTDEQGRATIPSVRLKETRAYATADGYAAGASEPLQLTAARPHAEALVVLTRGGRVEGVLRDVHGAPAAGIALSIHKREWQHLQRAEAAADGSFAFEQLPAGAYTLWTRADGEDLLRVPQQKIDLVVEEGRTTVARFDDLRASHVQLSGRVLRDGQPLSGASVWIHWNEIGEAPPGRTDETDADGRFAVTLDQPGEYRVQISRHDRERGAGGSYFRVIDVPAVPAFEVEIAWATGAIEGRVLDPAGEPAPGARVSVSGRSAEWACLQSATADETGRYEATELAPGAYEVRAASSTARGGAASAKHDGPVEVVAGGRVRGIDLQLPAIASIEGRVVGVAGEPIASARVHVASQPSPMFHPNPVQTDAAGAFALHDLEPGEHWVRARWEHDVSPWTRVTASVGAPARVDVVLTPGAELTVRVDADPESLEDAYVHVYDDQEHTLDVERLGDGIAVLDPLTPGTYVVRLHSRSRGTLAEQTVTLASAEERTVTLRLEE